MTIDATSKPGKQPFKTLLIIVGAVLLSGTKGNAAERPAGPMPSKFVMVACAAAIHKGAGIRSECGDANTYAWGTYLVQIVAEQEAAKARIAARNRALDESVMLSLAHTQAEARRAERAAVEKQSHDAGCAAVPLAYGCNGEK